MRVAIGFLLALLIGAGCRLFEFLRLPRMPFWACCWWLQCQLAISVWDIVLGKHSLLPASNKCATENP
jgi:hypothetical protein